MEHCHILRFLFVRGLSATFLVGGLVMEDRQYGLREGTVL